MDLVVLIIRCLHIFLIVFMVGVPLTKNVDWSLLVLHLSTSILLLLHWAVNEDKCAMTYLESYIRGIPVSNSFMYQLVSSVYNINDEKLKKIVTFSTIILGGISAYRLYKSWDFVKSQLYIVRSFVLNKIFI